MQIIKIILLVFGFLIAPALLWADSLEVRVSAGMDDVEENQNGGVYSNSSDLELVRDDWRDQTVGIRFQNVNIPVGATINSAYIEFEVDDTYNQEPCSLLIVGHDVADAPAFTTTDYDVSSRSTTLASVVWEPDNWNSKNAKKQTDDLASIVQEVINNGGWASGNSMVFIITGNGRRSAESYNGESSAAPLLHLDYTTSVLPYIDVEPAGQLGASSYVGSNAAPATFTLSNIGSDILNYSISDDVPWLSCAPASGALGPGGSVAITATFVNSTMAVGTHEGHITITDTLGGAPNSPFEYDVSLLIQEVPTGPTCGDVPIYAENLVNPGIMVLLDVSSSMNSQMTIGDPEGNPQTPDLSAIIQEIINQGGWNSGNAMAFVITGSGERVAESYNGVPSAAPLLHIEYLDGGNPYTLEVRVNQGSDDAEENAASGSMYLTSSDLELVYDGHEQVVGIRFQNVTIPATATISSAYIEFTIDESTSIATTVLIKGELDPDAATFTYSTDNISSRATTASSTTWAGIPEWGGATTEARYIIGRNAISELVADQDISWGYGTWAFSGYPGPGSSPAYETTDPYSGDPYKYDLYTKIHAGIKTRDETETGSLQTLIEATTTTSGTPLGPSMLAARDYFAGNKIDEDGLYYDATLDCQPKFLIDVTDGMGYPIHTNVDIVEAYTNLLADEEVSVVAVGFGIDNASQIEKMAEIANERGEADEGVYALHEEDVGGVGLPFIAQSGQALQDALAEITGNIKQQLFYGASPAPTTSVDYGTFVITAQFNAADWSGDLIATPYDAVTGALLQCVDIAGDPTCDPLEIVGDCLCWTATDVMPANYKDNAWTITGPLTIPSGSGLGPAVAYLDSTLTGDNYICKPFGDIIRSTPVIVESPRRYYPYDNYRVFKYGNALTRSPQVYVGANDGALHSLHLLTGAESWRFYPEAVHETLNTAAVDPSYDPCDGLEYCHRYYVDGSPVVADLFKGTSFVTYLGADIYDSAWRTILINGLGEGGAAYFAMDITSGNPISVTETDPLAATTYLWQFTDGELGQTMADVTVDRVTSSAVSGLFGGWAAYMGSGYSVLPAPDDQAHKEAYIFGVQAYTMDDLWLDEFSMPTSRFKLDANDTLSYVGQAIDFSVGAMVSGALSGATAVISEIDDDGASGSLLVNSISGAFQADEQITGSMGGSAFLDGVLHGPYLNDALSTPLVADLNFDHLGDNIYVGSLYGRMYRVTNIGWQQSPAAVALFDIGNKDHNTPIRAGADFAYSTFDDEIWLYFGTGRFESQADKVNVEQQYFVGMKDNLTTPTPLSSLADLVQMVASTQTDISTVTDYKVVTGSNPDKEPWYVILETGGLPSERIIAKPLVAGGVVFFTTFTPDNDVCAGNGEAWLYALDYETGLPPANPVFDINQDQKFNEDDMIDYGAGPTPVGGIYIGRGLPTSPVLEDKILFVTTTENPGSGIPVNLPDLQAKLKSWLDKGVN